ncbi:MAG: polyhydroxyalkanoic acid system family protein [bacterium]|nr:polyhydroxyalkanoic acid system family protein [bacterium]
MYQMNVSHKLPAPAALIRVKKLLGEVKEKYADKISDLREEWKDNVGTFSFSAMGYAVSGTLTVTDGKMDLSYDLPWAAKFFRGTIEAKIRERAETLLA